MEETDHNKTLKLYEWTAVKDKLHRDGNRPTIKEGQIWWCAWGENVGSEINGKGKSYSRPVLIVSKINQDCFVGVPLTSKVHLGSRFVSFSFKSRIETAIISQVKTTSVFRLYGYIGQVPNNCLENIRNSVCILIRKKMYPNP